MEKIINVAVIAHVDTGKSTLVDALLKQTGVFRENEEVKELVMDSNDLERERGITIYSKNCSVKYKDIKINIVDTPGHADFSSEVERIMKTVDTAILLVDSVDGPMPQTRVVLKNALDHGLKPILFINKIDKPAARVDEVINDTFDVFVDLNADDEQLDFPIVYGIARDGIAINNLDDINKDISPLLETIIKHVPCYAGSNDDSLQLQISSLGYDKFIGRLGIGRINKGKVSTGQDIAIAKRDGSVEYAKVVKLFVNEGINRVEKTEASYGEIVTIAGIPNISIGETICDKNNVEPMKTLKIEEPTLSMNFIVNDSPFVGKSGQLITTRQIKERLDKELETNVGLRIEELPNSDGYKVSGRGELHLSILLEQMRREGYELSVSKPTVLTKEINGETHEPFERVTITLPDEYAGTIISDMNDRKGTMENMESSNGYTTLNYLVPTRGLIGYRSEFIISTKGNGNMFKVFDSYKPYCGKISGRKKGVFVSNETGKSMAYSLWKISDKGKIIIEPATEVYEGMIVGINNRSEDLAVNTCKNKKLTNTRSSGADEAITLEDPKIFTLEEALEFIEDDELIEVTPDSIRLRKKELDTKTRQRNDRKETI